MPCRKLEELIEGRKVFVALDRACGSRCTSSREPRSTAATPGNIDQASVPTRRPSARQAGARRQSVDRDDMPRAGRAKRARRGRRRESASMSSRALSRRRAFRRRGRHRATRDRAPSAPRPSRSSPTRPALCRARAGAAAGRPCDLRGELLRRVRHALPDDRQLLLEARVIDPLIQAAALERIVHLARPVRGEDDERRVGGADGAELGDGDLEFGRAARAGSLRIPRRRDRSRRSAAPPACVRAGSIACSSGRLIRNASLYSSCRAFARSTPPAARGCAARGSGARSPIRRPRGVTSRPS